MAETVINNPSRSAEGDSSAAGWVAAIIVVGIVILGAMYLLPRMAATPSVPAPSADDMNINVSLPEGVLPSGGAPGGTDSGAAPQGN